MHAVSPAFTAIRPSLTNADQTWQPLMEDEEKAIS